MAEERSGRAPEGKPCGVSSLKGSRPQWLPQNEEKPASEAPTGWSPASLGGEPSARWSPNKPSPIQTLQTPAKGVSLSSEVGAPEEVTGTSGLLAAGLKEGSPLPGEERKRKSSNMMSSLTKSWKQVEDKQLPGEEGGGTTPASRAEDSGGDSGSTKRPPAPYKMSAPSKNHSTVGTLKSRWQDWAAEHTVNQKLNPFSEYFDHDYSMALRLQKGQEGYGRPKEGTKTAERAKRAEQHIRREIDDMCYVIRTMADPDPDGRTRVTFGQLFDRYVRISDKVVGILMRARKHGKVAFEGEMLWQGQDDGAIITLLV